MMRRRCKGEERKMQIGTEGRWGNEKMEVGFLIRGQKEKEKSKWGLLPILPLYL